MIIEIGSKFEIVFSGNIRCEVEIEDIIDQVVYYTVGYDNGKLHNRQSTKDEFAQFLTLNKATIV